MSRPRAIQGKQMIDRRTLVQAAGALCAAGGLGVAWPQARPSSVRVCVGFPPGSAADVVGRVVASKLSASGIPHIVDNRAGAGGRLAVDNIRQAPADGSAMLVTPDAIMTIYPHVYRKLTYQPLVDLRPVTTLCTVPLGIAVGPLVPPEVRTLAQFVAWAKANPAKASFGTSGAGTTLHFTGWMLAHAAGIELTHVPYRGSILAAQDMVAGQIAASINVLGEVLPFAQAGRARVLAVSGPTRSRFAPDTPTVREAGYASLESMTWFGLFLPAKTPDAVVASVQSAVVQGFNEPDARETLSKMAMDASTLSPPEFISLIRRDLDRWGPVVKETGYTSDD
jgi:tripartite-type tricarboxylate transporter receptor subunit TctC